MTTFRAESEGAAQPPEPEFLRRLRVRREEEGEVFWLNEGDVCILGAAETRAFNAANYRDQTLSDRLVDVLRRRRSPAISWKAVRAAWLTRLAELQEPAAAGKLAAAMEAEVAAALGSSRDLAWLAHEIVSRPLLSWVVAGLSARNARRLERDQVLKIRRILALPGSAGTRRAELRSKWVQLVAGWVVRSELRDRARSRRPRRSDLLDPVVDLLPKLGMDRAVDAVTAMLTAIAGPPGCSAACLMMELARRLDWRRRIGAELAEVSPESLAAAPARSAPVAHRFVKECLRLWSLPSLSVREVREELEIGGAALRDGHRAVLSAYFFHRDEEQWERPLDFDPDRWLEIDGAARCPHDPGAYVPFGWAPRACVGASLATFQMLVLCRLFCVDYRLRLNSPEALRVEWRSMPQVRNFDGRVERLGE